VTNWILRPAKAADASALAELAERTFRDAFSALNTAENMDLHCAAAFGTAVQAAEIANPAIYTVVAETEGKLVAFAQVHLHAQSPPGVPVARSVELHRIYVDRTFHGTGLAADLMERVLAKAGELNAAAIFLASSEASYVTGLILTVDGGYTAV
jgi:GNAT superfamily N-acetyltransferase